jgi:hypothetical protein
MKQNIMNKIKQQMMLVVKLNYLAETVTTKTNRFLINQN